MFKGLIGACIIVIVALLLLAKLAISVAQRRQAAERMQTLCTFCDRPTNPDVDLHDSKHRTWCHATCRQRFLEIPAVERHSVVRADPTQRKQAC